MARPFWSGTIQISLVSFAVEIYPATSTTRPISFHEVDRKTLGRIHRQNVAAGPASPEKSAEADDSEERDQPEEAEAASARHKTSIHIAPNASAQSTAAASHNDQVHTSISDSANQHTVQKADVVKGYEYEKGKYAIVEPAELKNLRLAGKKTVELSQFSKSTEIDPALYERPYFVLPKPGPQATAFAVIRQSMIDTGMVGLGEIVFSGRQHLMALSPPHDPKQPGMMLYTLRFATELRDVHEVAKEVESIPVDTAQLKLAKQLIDAYTRPFNLEDFKDHYEEALRELVEAKMQHLPVPAAEPEKKPAKVIDLMEALRRSLSQGKSLQASGTGAESKSATGS
ncbi:MAG TPA: Ku protein, partial [Acidobacteriaceae bacterium]